MNLDRAKRTSKPKTNLSAAHAKQPNTTKSRAQTSQNRNAKKLPIPLLSDALKKDETGPCQAQPAKTIRRKKSLKKSLTLRSDALQKEDERPAQQPDNALQAAAEPGQKYGGSMAASPYRKMKKGQRRPHGVGPKDPKPNAAFWCPKERWNSTVQNAPPNQKPTSRQPMRNSQTPPRHEPKPAKTAPQKNCLTLLSDALKKDETRPCKTHLQTKNQPLGSPCETAKHHLDTSPNQPKPHRKKTA